MSKTPYRHTGKILFGILLLAVGLFSYQAYYIRQTAPLIDAGLAEARRVGDARLEQIGIPPGAKLMEPIAKTTITGGRRGMWQGKLVGALWVAFYDAPGSHADIDRWYDEHLRPQGWKPTNTEPASTVQKEYYQDKWLLYISHEAWFTGRDAHARYYLRLSWDYLHRTEY